MRILLFTAIWLAGLLSPVTSWASDEVPDAYASVQQTTDVLLSKLREVQPLYKENPDAFFSAVDEALAPFVDFEGFAQGVMAKYYKRATTEQKAQFYQTFRKSLIETYAKALVEFDNQKVDVLRPEKPSSRPGRETVRLDIHGKDGITYHVDYTLTLKNNTWLLRNVIVNGINIGLQFRSQFAASMQRHRGDIGKVVQSWSSDLG